MKTKESKRIKAMYNCVGEDRYPYPDGLLYKDGKIVATNGSVICVLKSDYDSENEGKIIRKNGDLCDRRFPRWEEVIPKDYHDYPIDVDPKEILKATKNIKGITGLIYGKKIDSLIEINGCVFNARLLYDALFVYPEVKLYLCERVGLVGENDEYFFIIAGEKMDQEKIETKNKESLWWDFVKKIYTVNDALNYKPFEKVNFFDGAEIVTGKKIDTVEVNGKKIDVVYNNNYFYAVYNQVSQVCLHYNFSIDELIEKINTDEFNEIDFVIPENLNRKFFVIKTKDETTTIEEHSGRLVNIVKFYGEELEVIIDKGTYYWCLDGYSFTAEYSHNPNSVINHLNKFKYGVADIRAFINKHVK
jgi:hypothetical protein